MVDIHASLAASGCAPRFRVGDVLVDLTAFRAGTEGLSEQEVSLLAVLWAAQGSPVSREALYREVWGYRSLPRGRALDYAVRRLRPKLGQVGSGPPGIETVRGVGFRLSAAPVEAAAAPGAPRPRPQLVRSLRRLCPPDGFVGRARDLAELRTCLERPGVVTLLGPPGSGKTRLAVEALAEMPRLCLLVELGDLPSGVSPVGRLAEALGLPESARDVAAVGEALAARAECLVLFDRCAHVAAPLAELLGELREHACTFVATSRHRLGVPGEQLFDVGPLTEEDAVLLLMERARSVRRGVSLTAADPRGLGIVRRLGCLPLAIELAASRLRVWSPRQLDERLAADASWIGVVEGGELTKAMSWSWSLLSEPLQAALSALTLLGECFDAGSAEALWPEGGLDCWSGLEGLLDRSWLQMVEVDGLAEYRFHSPLRTWVREHHAPSSTSLTALVGHCLATSELAVGRLTLEAVRTAADHALSSGHPAAGTISSLAVRTAGFGMPIEAMAWGNAARQRLKVPSGDLAVELATLAIRRDPTHRPSLPGPEAVWSKAGRQRLRWLEVRVMLNTGDTGGALAAAQSLLADAETEGFEQIAAGVGALLVELSVSAGRIRDALAFGRRVLGDGRLSRGHAVTMIRLAPIYLMRGDLTAARDLFTRAEQHAISCANPQAAISAVVNAALGEALVGEQERSEAHLERALASGWTNLNWMLQCQVHLTRALQALARGAHEDARRHCRVVLEDLGGQGTSPLIAHMLIAEADLLDGLSASPAAAVAVALTHDSQRLLGSMAHGLQAWFEARSERWEQAVEHSRAACSSADLQGLAYEEAVAWSGAAVGLAATQPEESLAALEKAQGLAEQMAHLVRVPRLVALAQEEVLSTRERLGLG